MKVIKQTFSGLDILEMIKEDKIGCGEIIRHKREDVINQDGTPIYDYYKFTGWDKKFHRCNEKGKLGVKGQERFMIYNTIYKDFEFVVLEDKEYEDIEEITQECFDHWTQAKKINALIRNQKYILEQLNK